MTDNGTDRPKADNVVNLNRIRKAKDKKSKMRNAEENRVRFGRTKAQKTDDAKQSSKQKHLLDQHRLEDTNETP